MIISPLPLSFLATQPNIFDPATQLFGSSEQGFWYDIVGSFLRGELYQDSGATTPVTAVGDPVGYVTDISGNGNHATQSTGADRPIFGRWPQSAVISGFVRNELVDTSTLSTQNVTVTAAERTLSFKGTGTVTLSGASTAGPLVGTGANDRVSLTFTPSAGTLTLTVSGSVTDAQLELGDTVTGIQIVGASSNYDVTESGQPNRYFLYFNGTNHNLSTASIDFSASDKMSVFSGVTNFIQPVSANNIICEQSVSSVSNDGFGIFAPTGLGAGNRTDYGSLARTGGDRAGQGSGGVTQPTSDVFVSIMDAAQSTNLTQINNRLNGNLVQDIQFDGTFGPGNFPDDDVYIGARGSTSDFFNGNIYQLGARGALTSGSTLSGAENFIGQRMKGYL